MTIRAIVFDSQLSRCVFLLVALITEGILLPKAEAARLPGADDFQKVPIATGLANAVDFEFAPDGRIFILNRHGEIRVWKPSTQSLVVAAQFEIYRGVESGLLGIAIDPKFTTSKQVYIYYSPKSPKVNRLSRFDVEGDAVVLESEVVILEVPVDRLGGHHDGGNLEFDRFGHLYIGTGDEAFHSAYAPLDEVNPARSAEKSAANTMDLRGKILRIRPKPEGGYDIPSGNLFIDPKQGRPEIYVMGARNPYKFSIDAVTNWLFWGDVGPDANIAGVNGPAGKDEINRTEAAGNYGWPYFLGDNIPYRNTYLDYYFDPLTPTNDSRWNTGSRELPSAESAWITLPRPSAMMAGPVYRFDNAVSNPAKLPSTFDGHLFYWDFNTSRVWYVGFDEKGDIIRHELWEAISRGAQGYIDFEIGPDHQLYVLEYGTGCCAFDVGNGVLSRLDYIGVTFNRAPIAKIRTNKRFGSLPLTVKFSSAGTRDPDKDPLKLSWDFDTDGTVEATSKRTRHTYREKGIYNAQLKAEDPLGAVSIANETIHAGNNIAKVKYSWPPRGSTYDWDQQIDIAVAVKDREDGASRKGAIKCKAITVVPALGHLDHAHDVARIRLRHSPRKGVCKGTLRIDSDHNTNGEDDLYFQLQASYEDKDGLKSFKVIQLHPKRVPAEYHDAAKAVRVIKSSDSGYGARNAVRALRDRSYIVLKKRSLEGIEGVKYRVASAGSGGRIELRQDAPGGPLLGTVQVPPTGGRNQWIDVEGRVNDPGGVHDLYLVFRKSSKAAKYLFDLVSVEFLGAGISYRPNAKAALAPEGNLAKGQPAAVSSTRSRKFAPSNAPGDTFVPTKARYVRMHASEQASNSVYSLRESKDFGAASGRPVLSTMRVTPATATVAKARKLRFTAIGSDQYGEPFATPVDWKVSGCSKIDASGQFTANVVGGPVIVSATSRDGPSISGAAAVTVVRNLPLDNWKAHLIDNTLPWRAIFVNASDIDGDEKKDIVAGGRWYKNPGSAEGLWIRRDFGLPLNNMVLAKDLDDDGDTDIFGSKGAYTGVDLAWGENDGLGNFTIHENVPSGSSSYREPFVADFVSGTFEGKSKQQIALSWNGGENGSSSIQLLTVPPQNVDVENWQIESIHPVSLGEGLSEGDIDNDGDLDLFQGTQWLRNEQGDWTQFNIASLGNQVDRNRLADIDGDGDLDAVVGFLGNNTRLVWLEAPDNPTQSWTERTIAASIGGGLSLDVADFDNDMDIDVVLGEHYGAKRLMIFENVNNGSRWVAHIIHPGGLIDHHDGTRAVDIDNDGDLDIVSVGWNTRHVYLFENKANEAIGDVENGTTSPGFYDPETARLHLAADPGGTDTEMRYRFKKAKTRWLPMNGDWDGDGVETPAFFDPKRAKIHLRNCQGSGRAEVVYRFRAGQDGLLPVAGDWDGDGIDTPGVYDALTGTFSLRANNRRKSNRRTVRLYGAKPHWLPIAGDWDGDGIDSVGLFDPRNARVHLRNRPSTGRPQVSFAYGPENIDGVPVTGDWDADGVDTIGIYEPGKGLFHLSEKNGKGSRSSTIRYKRGGPRRIPLAGDWDGE